MKSQVLALVFSWGLSAVPALAQGTTPKLLRDINREPSPSTMTSSHPGPFVTIGAFTYFSATTDAVGEELFRITARQKKAQLVKDIHPCAGSHPNHLTTMVGKLFFSADDGKNGEELWISDGTESGTRMLKDIAAGGSSSKPKSLTVVGRGTLFFAASGELWKSDGTTAGTVRVSSACSDPTELTVMGDALYFSAVDSYGRELWVSTGTAAGTRMVKDIGPGSYLNGNPRHLTAFNQKLYFSAAGQDNNNPPTSVGFELYVSDGTTAGTRLVRDIFPGPTGSWPLAITVFNNALYFAATTKAEGMELWSSDGTARGTLLVKDINPGAADSYIDSILSVGGRLFIAATHKSYGAELWASDGTTVGTRLVRDIYPGPRDGMPRDFVAFQNKLYFSGTDNTPFKGAGTELWTSDGTFRGTGVVKDIYPGHDSWGKPFSSSPVFLTLAGQKIFFRADDGRVGDELFESDGTTAGTVLRDDIQHGQSGSTMDSDPYSFTWARGITFFTADDGVHGNELWRTDGTHAGTSRVRDIRPGEASSWPDYLTARGGNLFFRADDGKSGLELWRSDGSAAGTVIVKDIYPGKLGSWPSGLVALGNTVYFQAQNLSLGAELWRSDGTATGTFVVKDIRPGKEGSAPEYLTVLGDAILFSAWDGKTRFRALWRSDGTAAGTKMVKNVAPNVDCVLRWLTRVGKTVFFTAEHGTHGEELWSTDGTTAGTRLVRDIRKGSKGSEPAELTAVGETLYFRADDGVNGEELWRSDGTPGGTQMVRNIVFGGGDSTPMFLTAMGGILFFTADSVSWGRELWRSDGTVKGTIMVKDIVPGKDSGNPYYLTAAGNRFLYFSANIDSFPNRTTLWRSDGTAAGTTRVYGINPCETSAPTKFAFRGGRLLFEALHPKGGREIFTLFPGASAQAFGVGNGIGAVSSATDPVLGGHMTLSVSGVDIPALVLTFLGFEAAVTPYFGTGTLYLDPGLPLAGFPIPISGGRGGVRIFIPNAPNLAGFRIAAQTFLGPTNTPPLGVDFTNGMRLTLGK